MKPETIYAYVWDHATREMALTYSMLARLDSRYMTRLLWDDLNEEDRIKLRVVIKSMLDASNIDREQRRTIKQEHSRSPRAEGTTGHPDGGEL